MDWPAFRQVTDGYDVRWAGDDGSALALRLHQPGTVHMSVGRGRARPATGAAAALAGTETESACGAGAVDR